MKDEILCLNILVGRNRYQGDFSHSIVVSSTLEFKPKFFVLLKVIMRKFIRIIVQPMNLIGLNLLTPDTFFNCYIRIFVFCAAQSYGIFGTILSSYHSRGDFYNMIVPMAITSSCIVMMTTILSMHICKPAMRDVLCSINDHVFVYPDEENFKLNYSGILLEKNCIKLCGAVILFEVLGYAFSFLSPFIGYFLVGELHTYIYPQWIPWNVGSTFTYVFTYILQVPTATYNFMGYYMILLYYIFILVEFDRQYKKLQYAIESLDERSRKGVLGDDDEEMIRVLGSRNEEYDNAYKYNLIICVRHHQKLCE